MDTLDGTSWDVLISGTGIQQSLLALALSRSGKKVLHLDKDNVYGGSEAALSLQEAEQWAEKINHVSSQTPFSDAVIVKSTNDGAAAALSSSRAYSLSLAPTLLYTRSALLPALVSSRAHQQLEFQAVGSWFVYGRHNSKESDDGEEAPGGEQACLTRVPNGREDIFADQTLNLKAKGSLVRFLRFIATYEEKPEVWEPHKDVSFPTFLSQQFNLPAASHGPLLALSLSPSASPYPTVGLAIPRIARHLRSMGIFGPGFGAVIPKWGGLSEVAQVACRAGAVGGAVYVLGKGISAIETEDDDVEEVPRPELSQQDISQEVSDAIGASNFLPTDQDNLDSLETDIKEQSLDELLAAAGYSIDVPDDAAAEPAASSAVQEPSSVEPTPDHKGRLSVHLDGGDSVRTDFIIGLSNDLPDGTPASVIRRRPLQPPLQPVAISRSISISSAPLPTLFVPTAEGSVTPAGAMVVFPSGSLPGTPPNTPPVHIIVHTSDTGECPQGQSVLYASIASTGGEAFAMLEKAVKALLASQGSDIHVLWSLKYQQQSDFPTLAPEAEGESEMDPHIMCFPDPPLDLAFDDIILDHVKDAWQRIVGNAVNQDEFLKFEDREAVDEDVEEDD